LLNEALGSHQGRPLSAIPDTSISGKPIARELTMADGTRAGPQINRFRHGPEFTSNAILACVKPDLDRHATTAFKNRRLAPIWILSEPGVWAVRLAQLQRDWPDFHHMCRHTDSLPDAQNSRWKPVGWP
jgi:hypothetical protein